MTSLIKEHIIPRDIEYIKSNIGDIANQLGYSTAKYVNAGSYGLVFDVGDDKVLKITTDKNEAVNANKLRKKPFTKHIINYYDVRGIKNSKGRQYYSIVMDKVSPLNSIYSFYSGIYRVFLDSNITDKDAFTYVFDYLEKYKTEEEMNECLDFYKNNLQPQRQSILKEFKKYKVPTLDAHTNNVGFDTDGNFVFFDIGIESIGGGDGKVLKPISVKEWMVKNEKSEFSKETKKSHIYNGNNVKYNKKNKQNMEKIKLTESDLANIVSKVVNEMSEPRIMKTFEPIERNAHKSNFTPTPKKEVSLYDKDMVRKEITQNVVDRIIKYGDMYINEVKKLNSKFPIKKDRFKQY